MGAAVWPDVHGDTRSRAAHNRPVPPQMTNAKEEELWRITDHARLAHSPRRHLPREKGAADERAPKSVAGPTGAIDAFAVACGNADRPYGLRCMLHHRRCRRLRHPERQRSARRRVSTKQRYVGRAQTSNAQHTTCSTHTRVRIPAETAAWGTLRTAGAVSTDMYYGPWHTWHIILLEHAQAGWAQSVRDSRGSGGSAVTLIYTRGCSTMCHICTGTGHAPARSAPDWAHPCHICAGTRLTCARACSTMCHLSALSASHCRLSA